MSTYPSRYQLPELTAHLVALLERRRLAFERWDEATEASLAAEAKDALAEAGTQFREVADDPAYWARTERTMLTVALGRYLRVAKAQHAAERAGYGAWRGGDFVSRAAYAGIGLVVGLVAVRLRLPVWLEVPVPVTLFLLGPLIPDLQAWFAKRRYAKQLATLVEEMRHEQADAQTYEPFGVEGAAPVAPVAGEAAAKKDGEKAR